MLRLGSASRRTIGSATVLMAAAFAASAIASGGNSGSIKKTSKARSYTYKVVFSKATHGFEIDLKNGEQFVSESPPTGFLCSITYMRGVSPVKHHDHMQCSFGSAKANKTLSGSFKLNKALASKEGAKLYAQVGAGRIGPFPMTGP